MRPQMQEAEIRLIEQELLAHGSHVDVLEWGSGGSTVYFTRFLKGKGISYTWTSIEYNKLWYEKIREEVKGDQNTKLILFDVGNTELKQRLTPMDEYVSFPATLGCKFDIIIVDGRKRRRCLLEAAKLLKPFGAVFLHDGRRTYYHCALQAFPDSQLLLFTGLWRGKLEQPSLFRKILNMVEYWCFRAYTFSFRFRSSYAKN